MDQSSDGFQHLKVKFGAVQSDAELKTGIFDWPQIRELIRDKDSPSKLRPLELKAWESFFQVLQNFLGNHKAQNYEKLVGDMLKSYKHMDCRRSTSFTHNLISSRPTWVMWVMNMVKCSIKISLKRKAGIKDASTQT